MLSLEGKKLIFLGDRDGIAAPAMEKCFAASGLETAFAATECFHCAALGTLSAESQKGVLECAKRFGAGACFVILGSSDEECAHAWAEAVTRGTPEDTGPLAGVALGLSVCHIFDPDLRPLIPKSAWAEELEVLELISDAAAVTNAVREERTKNM